jgi:hypothetical protein
MKSVEPRPSLYCRRGRVERVLGGLLAHAVADDPLQAMREARSAAARTGFDAVDRDRRDRPVDRAVVRHACRVHCDQR